MVLIAFCNPNTHLQGISSGRMRKCALFISPVAYTFDIFLGNLFMNRSIQNGPHWTFWVMFLHELARCLCNFWSHLTLHFRVMNVVAKETSCKQKRQASGCQSLHDVKGSWLVTAIALLVNVPPDALKYTEGLSCQALALLPQGSLPLASTRESGGLCQCLCHKPRYLRWSAISRILLLSTRDRQRDN